MPSLLLNAMKIAAQTFNDEEFWVNHSSILTVCLFHNIGQLFPRDYLTGCVTNPESVDTSAPSSRHRFRHGIVTGIAIRLQMHFHFGILRDRRSEATFQLAGGEFLAADIDLPVGVDCTTCKVIGFSGVGVLDAGQIDRDRMRHQGRR